MKNLPNVPWKVAAYYLLAIKQSCNDIKNPSIAEMCNSYKVMGSPELPRYILSKGISIIFETKDWDTLKKEWDKQVGKNIQSYLTKEGKKL